MSIWKYKPWWCQPWSILLTGTTIITASWFLFQIIWLTIIIAIPLLIWMGFFLLLYPRLIMQNMTESQTPDMVRTEVEQKE